MVYPWTSKIRLLRRRAIVAGAVAQVGGVLLWLTPAALVYVGWSQFSAWGRYLAPIAGVASLAAIGVAALTGMVRARRSDTYFAKWIDLCSGLDDRLSSAV